MNSLLSASRYVGLGVAQLINLYNPRMVIIGGRLAEAGDLVLNAVRDTAKRRTYPLSYAGVEIVRNALGPDSCSVGACALVVDRYLAACRASDRLHGFGSGRSSGGTLALHGAVCIAEALRLDEFGL